MATSLFSRLRAANSPEKADKTAPFPYRQLLVLAICRLGEPIAFMSIFPYIYYMIKSFDPLGNEDQIATYAGLVTAAFAFAEFCAGTFWGSLSDKIGRKPVLLTGLAGTGISMLCFGFSTKLWMAVLARAIGGILNGNIGVINTTVAEVVAFEAHKPRAFSIMPMVWCVGSIIGASIGGTLAEPAKNFPTIFAVDGLFGKYPFLLPNLVCTAFIATSFVFGLFFLEETHEDKKDRKDPLVAIGKRFLLRLQRGSACDADPIESETLLQDEKTPQFSSTELPADYSPRPSSTISDASTFCETTSTLSETPTVCGDAPPSTKQKLSWQQGFNRQVILTIIGFGLLAFHTIALEQLLPVLFSMPESNTPIQLPFWFVGGFGLSSQTVGFILSSQGILQLLASGIVMPFVSKRLGALRTFQITILAYPMLYIIVPYLALLPQGPLRYFGVTLVLVWKVTAQALAFPSVQLMLTGYSPSNKVLGTIMGVSSSSASLARAFGPLLAGLVQAWGLSMGVSGLSWWFCAIIAFIGLCVSRLMQSETKVSTMATALSKDDIEEDQV